MFSDVLQVFATCIQAAPFLAGEVEKAPELFGQHSTYRAVHDVSFVRAGIPNRDGVMADRVAPWLRRLKSEGVEDLRPLLSPHPPHSQGEQKVDWGIITDGDRGIELWQPVSKARVLGRDDPSPFKVVFTATRFNRWALAIPASVEESSAKLLADFEAAVKLCEECGDRYAKQYARQTFDMVVAKRKSIDSVPDLFPQGIASEPAILAAAAVRAYQFLDSKEWSIASRNAKEQAAHLSAALWKSTMAALESAADSRAYALRHAA